MYLIKISQTFAPLRLASCVRSSVRVCGRSVGFIHVPSLPRHVPSGFRTCPCNAAALRLRSVAHDGCEFVVARLQMASGSTVHVNRTLSATAFSAETDETTTGEEDESNGCPNTGRLNEPLAIEVHGNIAPRR